MSRTWEFSHAAFTEASVPVVAQVLADADGWARWARPYLAQSHCERWGVDTETGVGAVRRVGAAPVWIRELITEWDPAGHQTYTMLSPYVFDRYRGMVSFTEVVDGGTHIVWSVDFESRPILSGLVLRSVMSFVIAGLLGRLVAECDRVHRGRQWTVAR